MGTPSTVGVDDDLAAGETCVTLGTADDEETGGLDLLVVSHDELKVEREVLRGTWCAHRGT